MKHVVNFSGGVGSYATAKRVIACHGQEDTVLVFADTKTEDEDLYRFLFQAVEFLGCPFVHLADGRDVWQVFHDRRFLGNSLVDPCSRILKREIIGKWLTDNCDPLETIVYLGFDWTESHRLVKARPKWADQGWRIDAPMCHKPYTDKQQMLSDLEADGIAPPRLYARGYAHNNCGGFCVKAGHAQFALLLKDNPERYLYHEQKEREFRQYIGKDVAILTDRRNGEKKPMTMESFRERLMADEPDLYDPDDFGGCNCFNPEDGL